MLKIKQCRIKNPNVMKSQPIKMKKMMVRNKEKKMKKKKRMKKIMENKRKHIAINVTL